MMIYYYHEIIVAEPLSIWHAHLLVTPIDAPIAFDCYY
jgi:hypothetical protein